MELFVCLFRPVLFYAAEKHLLRAALISCFLFLTVCIQSQTLNYSFSTATVAYAANPLGSNTIMCCGADEALAGPNPIGFTFKYACTTYTDFTVSDNGWLTFNSSCIFFDGVNNLPGNATQVSNGERPLIAPLWDDLGVDNFGNVTYTVTGAAGSRTLTVEWSKMWWRAAASVSGITFQVKLMETTNRIAFYYKQEPGGTNLPTASIGLAGASVGDYYSLNNSGSSPTASKAVNTANIATKPATNQVYIWDPVCTLPVELLSFRAYRNGAVNKIEWETASEINSDYFVVEKSTDAINYTQQAKIQNAHNSHHQLHYSVIDAKPGEDITYYRLKEVSLNGTEHFYAPVAVLSDKDPVVTSVFPNPFSDKLNVLISCDKAAVYTLEIDDVYGAMLFAQKVNLERGNNSIDIQPEVKPGLCILRLLTDENRQLVVSKLIKN